MVPRGGLPRSKKIKVLRRSGTANFPRSSLGFLPTVSHRSLIVSSPTNEAMSANAMCSGIGRAQSSSLFANGSLSDPAKNEILVPPESGKRWAERSRKVPAGLSLRKRKAGPAILTAPRLARCILWATGFKSALIATGDGGGGYCDVEDGALPEHFAGRT